MSNAKTDNAVVKQKVLLDSLFVPIPERCCYTDILTINSVQSIFEGGKDPYSRLVLPYFIDMYVFSDEIRYPVNTLSDRDPKEALPRLALDLKNFDKGSVGHVDFSVSNTLAIDEEKAALAFDDFCNYCLNNKTKMRGHMRMHHADWLKKQRGARIGDQKYIFSVDKLRSHPRFKDLQLGLNVSEDDVLYVFDITLRYSLYGSLVADGKSYISHPLRSRLNRATTISTSVSIEPLPLHIGRYITPAVSSMDYHEFRVFLYEARALIHQRGIHRLSPGEIDQETAREIAMKLCLPPKLKGSARAASVIAGIMGCAGAYMTSYPAISAAGALIGSLGVWSGSLPKDFGKSRWLSGLFEWDIEKEAMKNTSE